MKPGPANAHNLGSVHRAGVHVWRAASPRGSGLPMRRSGRCGHGHGVVEPCTQV